MRKFLIGLYICSFFLGGVVPTVQAVNFGEKVNDLFPSWAIKNGEKRPDPVRGVIGENNDGEKIIGTAEKTEKVTIHYLPTLINILLKFAAPIVLVFFLYAGVRLVYHSDTEDEIQKSKTFFMYALMGVLFIVLSYSLLKVLYFLLAP